MADKGKFTAQDAASLRGYEFPEEKVGYNTRDVLIYNLGVGATEPAFTFEGDPAFQGPLPTFPLCLVHKRSSLDIVPFSTGEMLPPALSKVPQTAIVHGEQWIELLKPLPISSMEGLVHRTKVVDLEDKWFRPALATFSWPATGLVRVDGIFVVRSGALISLETHLVEKSSGEILAKHLSKVFLKGMGGFSEQRQQPPTALKRDTAPHGERMPSKFSTWLLGWQKVIGRRAGEVRVELSTLDVQAQLYRLSGDYNALHVDEAFARRVGFPRPVLHGLATLGFAARAVIRALGDNIAASLKAIGGRFAAPVLPGDTLLVSMWPAAGDESKQLARAEGELESTDRVYEFEVRVKGRTGPMAIVISRGKAVLGQAARPCRRTTSRAPGELLARL